MPSILVGLRFALGLMWVLLIVAETVSAQSGIGYMTMNARKFLPLVALAGGGDFTPARRQTLEALAFYRRTGETLDQFGLQQTLASIAIRERDWAAAERYLAELS